MRSAPEGPFGEMSIIDGLPRSASAVAAEETTALVLTKEKFELILTDNPKLGVSPLCKTGPDDEPQTAYIGLDACGVFV